MKRILLAVLLLAGCAQLPPSAEELRAKRFETVPGKAIIYVVRTPLDSHEPSGLTLNDNLLITTFGGTFGRFEVEPGTHRIREFASGTAAVTLNATAGGLYFVEHTVLGDRDDGGVTSVSLRQVGEQEGRTMVMNAQSLM